MCRLGTKSASAAKVKNRVVLNFFTAHRAHGDRVHPEGSPRAFCAVTITSSSCCAATGVAATKAVIAAAKGKRLLENSMKNHLFVCFLGNLAIHSLFLA